MSGMIRRIMGGRRQETATRQESTSRFPTAWGSATSNSNAPPSFVSELIRRNVSNRDSREHQRMLALYSAVGFNITVKLAQNAFDDWFEFVDANGNVIMQDVQAKLWALNAQYYFTQALVLERIYGHSWVFIGKEKMREDIIQPEGRRVTNLDVFGPENSQVIEYDQYGNPKTIEVTVLQGLGAGQTKEVKKRIDIADLSLLRTRPRPFDRSYEGLPVLYSVWTNLISLERTLHSSDFYLAKIGHGMYTAITEGALSESEMTALESTMEEASISRVAIVNGRKVRELTFINAQGSPIDFPAEIDSRLGIIAAGTGVPKDLLVGISAGAQTGSEVNVKSLYQTLNQIQTSCEPTIRDTVRAVGHKSDDYFIRWITRYAHDEEQQSKIRMNDAQAWAIKSKWMTINEIRAEHGMSPISGGEGLSEDFKVNVQGLQTAAEAEQTHNAEGANL